MEYKTIQGHIGHSSANEVAYIQGYASVFNIKDDQNDIIMSGAFSGYIDRYSSIKFLWQHDNKAEIGKWTHFNEDHHGFYVEGSIPLTTQFNLEAYKLIDSGSIKGLSIGYKVLDSEIKNNIRYIKKLELLEISVVTFPANPMAVIHNMGEYLSDVTSGISNVYEEAKKAVRNLRDAIRSKFD